MSPRRQWPRRSQLLAVTCRTQGRKGCWQGWRTALRAARGRHSSFHTQRCEYSGISVAVHSQAAKKCTLESSWQQSDAVKESGKCSSLPPLRPEADADNAIPPENDLALGCHGRRTYEDKTNSRCLKDPRSVQHSSCPLHDAFSRLSCLNN